jgi:hypothetical protein
MMNKDQMQMWEEATRLQEFRTRGRGYAGPSRPDDKAKAAEKAHVAKLHADIKANGAKLTAAEQAKQKEQK